MTHRFVPSLLLALGACPSTDDAPPALIDTGWFDSDEPLGCGGEVLATLPEAGSSGHVVHDPITVQLRDTTGLEGASVVVQPVGGAAVPAETAVDETTVTLTISPTAPLEPSTDHEVVVRSCSGTLVVPFTTSSFGAPLLAGPAALRGRTWALSLADATWIEPAGVAPLFRANIDAPVLVGVQWADGARLDLLGAQGEVSGTEITQDPRNATWALPDGDFSEAPRFRASSDRVVLEVLGVPLPVEDFVLQATFAADGGALGDGVLRGRLDTRGAGPLLNAGSDPGSICGLAQSVGLDCIPCADGAPYCLVADLRDVGGQEVQGLRLVPVPPADP